MFEVQSSDLNQDGSITIKLGGKDIQFVKESDLGAVKANLTSKETELSKLQADLATSNSSHEETRQSLLKEKAAKELLETNATENTTLKATVAEMETKMADAVKVSGDVSTKLTDRVRKHLSNGYKIDVDKIKDMSLDDLERTEAALILTGVPTTQTTYDGKGSASGSPSSLEGKSPLALATMGYEQSAK